MASPRNPWNLREGILKNWEVLYDGEPVAGWKPGHLEWMRFANIDGDAYYVVRVGAWGMYLWDCFRGWVTS